MALRSGYKGFKKLLPGLKIIRPGTLGIDNDVLIPELNKTFFPRSEQAVLGAKNQLNTYVDALKKINTAGTWLGNAYTLDGVTFTVANDGKITANNQSTAIVYFNLDTSFDTAKYAGWKMNGLPSDGANNTFMFRISASAADRAGIQDFESNVDTPITNNGSGKCLSIRIANGYNPNGIVFSPMVSLDGGAYVPYAMTNNELTDVLTPSTGTVTAETGFTVHPNTKLEKSGNMVTLGIFMSGVSATEDTWTHIANIPEGFRPRSADSLMGTVFWAGGSNHGQLQVLSNGKIQIYSSTALNNTVILANLSWVTE